MLIYTTVSTNYSLMQNDIPVLSVDPSVDGNDKDDLDVPQIALEEMIKELSLGEI